MVPPHQNLAKAPYKRTFQLNAAMPFFSSLRFALPGKVEVIHNASVMGAVASCGLQLYNFGQTVSIPLWTENWEPDSFHDKIKINKAVRA